MGEGTATNPQFGRRRIIERPRLIRMLDESPERIKLLVAPAGYGKTTLARQWLGQRCTAVCSLGSSAKDVAALAADMATAVAEVVPGGGEAVIERLSVTARAEEEVDVLAGMLRRDLTSWKHDQWLYLDDYHMLVPGSPSDRFVEAVLADASLNVLLTTRQRPSWASARRLLYGEIFELNREELAMTDSEAQEVLAARERSQQEDIIKAAAGWPAVLGLASATQACAPNLASLPNLYSFFAEEIYQRMEATSRRLLCELALYGTHTDIDELAITTVSALTTALISAHSSGFILHRSPSGFALHPLARDFLERKLQDDFPNEVKNLVHAAIERALAAERWDDASDLITRHNALHLLPNLLRAALPTLLETGRVTTIRNWVRLAPEDVPSARLASAELAFREGRFFESEVVADILAQEERLDDDLVTRALIVAGRAAHASSRLQESLNYYKRAAERAPTPALHRNSLFGEIGALNELERADEARAVLQQIGPSERLAPADRVILTGRQLNLDSHTRGYETLAEAKAASQLLKFVRDPIARCSFRNVYGYSLVSSCRLDEAERITQEQLDDAERCRIDFVMPYALVIRALVLYLRHDYSRSEATVADALGRAEAADDMTALGIAHAAQARIFNAQGAFARTLSVAVVTHSSALAPWVKAELEASLAVACAAIEDYETTLEAVSAAETLSQSPETRISLKMARAIAEHRRGKASSAFRHASDALLAVQASNVIEVFVSAYRGWPELVLSLLGDTRSQAPMTSLLRYVGDASLGDRAEDTHGSILALSPREKEVLGLVARGFTNRAIAEHLFISPVTVKVHVRHIFEKLGVKSRAEAALRGAQLGRS